MVRTSWRSATSTPEFMAEHRRRQPSLPIIDGHGEAVSFVALPTSQQLWPFLSRCRKSCCEIRLHASSDGFLIVSRGDRFYICNPTNRKHALLPFSRPPRYSFTNDSHIHGLYQHKSTGEYRVLWSRLSESRSIQLVLPRLPSPSLEQTYELIYQLSSPLPSPSPVHHRGNLHWLLFRPNLIPGSGSTGVIIVFDTEAESFRWMRNPAHHNCMLSSLFNMEVEGRLAFLAKSLDGTTMDVWVMQDYETHIWAFKYRIDVSMVEASSRPLDSTSRKLRRKTKQPLDSTARFLGWMTPLNERELLVGFNGKHVLRCDTDCKFLGMVTIGKKQYCMELTRHRIQESIMPIPSGEMQGEDEEFPFSTEHV
ncbi:hypothetical protein VPH35_139862 [Triticum aestivum]